MKKEEEELQIIHKFNQIQLKTAFKSFKTTQYKNTYTPNLVLA